MYDIADLESEGYAETLSIDVISDTEDLSYGAVAGLAIAGMGGAYVGWHAGKNLGHFRAWWNEATPAGIEKAELMGALKGAALTSVVAGGAGAYAGWKLEKKWTGDGKEPDPNVYH